MTSVVGDAVDPGARGIDPQDDEFCCAFHRSRSVGDRSAAPRTVEAVFLAIGQLLDAFTPQECANYFKNSGYERT